MNKILIALLLALSACQNAGKTKSTPYGDKLSQVQIFALECSAYQSEQNQTGKNMLLCQPAFQAATNEINFSRKKIIAESCIDFEKIKFSTASECRMYYEK